MFSFDFSRCFDWDAYVNALKSFSLVIGIALALSVLLVEDGYVYSNDEDGFQSESSVGVYMDVPAFLTMRLVGGDTVVDLGASGNGEDLIKLSANTFELTTNAPHGWEMFIYTQQDDLGPLDAPNSQTRKPVKDFFWRSSHNHFGHLSHDKYLAAKTDNNGQDEVSFDYQVDIKPSDAPGSYIAHLEFFVALSSP